MVISFMKSSWLLAAIEHFYCNSSVVLSSSHENLAEVPLFNRVVVVVCHPVQLLFLEDVDVHGLEYLATIFVEKSSQLSSLVLPVNEAQ